MPPGLAGTTLVVRHRLSSPTIDVVAPSGAMLVTHRLAPAGSGALVRSVSTEGPRGRRPGAFTTARPCDKKANRPPGREALEEAARLLGPIDVSRSSTCASVARSRGTMSEPSTYQEIRAHLAYLRLGAAAEALPGELDHARRAQGRTPGFLARVLEVEARDRDPSPGRARRPACLPPPWTLATSCSVPSPRWTRG